MSPTPSSLPPLPTASTRSSTLPFRKEEAQKVARSPHAPPPLHPPFEGLRSHHFQFLNAQYRIAYRIREDKRQVEIVLVKSRERFYEILARVIRQR